MPDTKPPSLLGFIILCLFAVSLLLFMKYANADCTSIYSTIEGCSLDQRTLDRWQLEREQAEQDYEREQMRAADEFNRQMEQADMQRAYDEKLKALEDELRRNQ